MVTKYFTIAFCCLFLGCSFRSPKDDEVLVIVSADYGQDVISAVRLGLREIVPSKSSLVTFREKKESLIYIDKINQSEFAKYLDEFNELNSRGKLVPSDTKNVYFYSLKTGSEKGGRPE